MKNQNNRMVYLLENNLFEAYLQISTLLITKQLIKKAPLTKSQQNSIISSIWICLFNLILSNCCKTRTGAVDLSGSFDGRFDEWLKFTHLIYIAWKSSLKLFVRFPKSVMLSGIRHKRRTRKGLQETYPHRNMSLNIFKRPLSEG